MPLRLFKCKECSFEKRSFKSSPACPQHGSMSPELSSPNLKFTELVDPYKGRKQMKGQQEILKKRAREHSRDVDMDFLIQSNPRSEAIKNGWVDSDGKKRRKISDL